jgi:flagellar motility protein MotE (MotC chaperone)
MTKLLKSGWLASLIGAFLYLGTTALMWRLPATPDPGSAEVPPATAADATLDFRNPELDLLVEELKQEKEALAKRQTQLNELAERLRIERLELAQVTQRVHYAASQFDSNVVRVLDEEQTNLKKLARTYAAMSPEGAAAVFRQMEEETLLKILALMKDAETAPILESIAKQGELEAKRVAVLSERLRLSFPKTNDSKRNL